MNQPVYATADRNQQYTPPYRRINNTNSYSYSYPLPMGRPKTNRNYPRTPGYPPPVQPLYRYPEPPPGVTRSTPPYPIIEYPPNDERNPARLKSPPLMPTDNIPGVCPVCDDELLGVGQPATGANQMIKSKKGSRDYLEPPPDYPPNRTFLVSVPSRRQMPRETPKSQYIIEDPAERAAFLRMMFLMLCVLFVFCFIFSVLITIVPALSKRFNTKINESTFCAVVAYTVCVFILCAFPTCPLHNGCFALLIHILLSSSVIIAAGLLVSSGFGSVLVLNVIIIIILLALVIMTCQTRLNILSFRSATCVTAFLLFTCGCVTLVLQFVDMFTLLRAFLAAFIFTMLQLAFQPASSNNMFARALPRLLFLATSEYLLLDTKLLMEGKRYPIKKMYHMGVICILTDVVLLIPYFLRRGLRNLRTTSNHDKVQPSWNKKPNRFA